MAARQRWLRHHAEKLAAQIVMPGEALRRNLTSQKVLANARTEAELSVTSVPHPQALGALMANARAGKRAWGGQHTRRYVQSITRNTVREDASFNCEGWLVGRRTP